MKPDKENPSTAPEWIAEIAEGPLTHTDKAALTDWLRESPRHVREFLELTLLQEDLKALTLEKEQIDAWVREARQFGAVALSPMAIASDTRPCTAGTNAAETNAPEANTPEANTPETHDPTRHLWPRIWALAASIVLAVTAAGGYYWWNDGRYVTRLGEQKIITLADGSVVTLNTSSELKVRLTDDKRALHLLEGEAFFRVAHDPSRPFEVTAQGATVRAVGTQFNVRIAPTATVVSVLDGAVEVRERHPERDRDTPKPGEESGASVEPPVVRVAKGEEVRIARKRLAAARTPDASETATPSITVIEPEQAAVARSAAWIKGRVEFEDTPLADVLNEFRRYREFSVEIDAPLRELKLTGSFDAQDPESALAYIDTLPGVAVERPAPQVFIVRQE